MFGYFTVKSMGYMMIDDGWRHLAMALHEKEIKSWGNLFIHSLYGDFDPWFIWHNILKYFGLIFGNSNIHLVINTIVYFLLSSWFYLILKKFTSLPISMIILLSFFLPLFNARYFLLRADIFSGLFILYSILFLDRRITFLLSFLYSFSYYISWFFLGYLAFINFILKEFQKVLLIVISLILGITFYLLVDYEGYISIISNVLNNEKLTSYFSVTESGPTFFSLNFRKEIGSILLLLVLIILSILSYYTFKPKNILFKYLILFMPLILIQVRFYFLLEPLVIVCIILFLNELYKLITTNDCTKLMGKTKLFIKRKTYFYKIRKSYYYIIFFTVTLLFFTLSFQTHVKIYSKIGTQLNLNSFLKNEEFRNKRILINKMNFLMNTSILYNPTGKYVTSFSLGWVDYDKRMKDIYFKIIGPSVINGDKLKVTEKELFEFINYNKVDYFIIDTKFKVNFQLSNKTLEKNNFIFYKIIEDYIIFKKRINE